ncbi:hypothetical protein L4C36_09025 [Photobacterium japonica]|uniref:hypothetical protein n=1 Tax=Photobacterium japonica TaxID=2910235 RepID=UPI003D1524F4
MNNKTFHVGGSIEKALKGKSELQPVTVLQEAWRTTAKNFVSFLPALVIVYTLHIALLQFVFNLQGGGQLSVGDMFFNESEAVRTSAAMALNWASMWSSVVTAPLYAGIALMTLNFAVGLPSKVSHLMKGMSFSLVAIVTEVMTIVLLILASQIFPPLGLLLPMFFGMAIILICEKRLSPVKAIQYSFMATLRNFVPILAIYLAIVVMGIISLLPMGLGLIWTVPFYFNAKAIIYRNLFGVTLQVTTVEKGEDDNNTNDKEDPQVFNA